MPIHAIQWESGFIDDLGLTMLQFTELTLFLEQEFDFELEGSEAFNLTSMGQLVNYIILHADKNKTYNHIEGLLRKLWLKYPAASHNR